MSYRKKVSYFYDPDVGIYLYSIGHPMKPHRMRIIQSLLLNYGVTDKMSIYRPWRATAHYMTRFHSDDYINILSAISNEPRGLNEDSIYKHQFAKYNFTMDCPAFPGVFDLCQIAAGGSVCAARKLITKESEIAINWAGGLHHAKRSKASGFCYVNDIVLAILELLRVHERVLYIDIDVHHGDGVEEAFYTTSRVLTISLHKYGKEFFPQTGALTDTGIGLGKYYSINVPLNSGVDDASYEYIFKPLVERVVAWYRPGAVVLQCGADSLAGDRLGPFNLTIKGHGKCIEHVKSFGLPLLLVGGGGYTVKNTARCWCNETAIAVGEQLDDELPYNDYMEYFGPDFRLSIPTMVGLTNCNSRQSLETMLATILSNVKNIQGAPEVPVMKFKSSYEDSRSIYGVVPRPFPRLEDENEFDEYGEELAGNEDSDDDYYNGRKKNYIGNKKKREIAHFAESENDHKIDKRSTREQVEQRVTREDEFYDMDDDEDMGLKAHRRVHRQRNRTHTREDDDDSGDFVPQFSKRLQTVHGKRNAKQQDQENETILPPLVTEEQEIPDAKRIKDEFVGTEMGHQQLTTAAPAPAATSTASVTTTTTEMDKSSDKSKNLQEQIKEENRPINGASEQTDTENTDAEKQTDIPNKSQEKLPSITSSIPTGQENNILPHIKEAEETIVEASG